MLTNEKDFHVLESPKVKVYFSPFVLFKNTNYFNFLRKYYEVIINTYAKCLLCSERKES